MRISLWAYPFLAVASLAGLAWSQLSLNFGNTDKKIEEALPTEPVVKPKEPRKILVFTKTNGFRHGSIPVGKKALELLGEKTGSFEVISTEDLVFFEKDKLEEFDAVLFFNTTMDVFRPRNFEKLKGEDRTEAELVDKRLKKNLMAFVESGKGFIGLHAATDTFYEWPEYGEMIGGYFDGHPWTSGTKVSVRVADGQLKHPIVTEIGTGGLDFKEEIYQFKSPYDSKKVHMLLRLDTKKTDMKRRGMKRGDMDYGVAWIKNHGKGRVFYSSLGHNNHIFWNDKVLQHYLAGIQWALGDLEVPVTPATAN